MYLTTPNNKNVARSLEYFNLKHVFHFFCTAWITGALECRIAVWCAVWCIEIDPHLSPLRGVLLQVLFFSY